MTIGLALPTQMLSNKTHNPCKRKDCENTGRNNQRASQEIEHLHKFRCVLANSGGTYGLPAHNAMFFQLVKLYFQHTPAPINRRSSVVRASIRIVVRSNGSAGSLGLAQTFTPHAKLRAWIPMAVRYTGSSCPTSKSTAFIVTLCRVLSTTSFSESHWRELLTSVNIAHLVKVDSL